MENILNEIPEQLGYQIISEKHKPVHCFYRFKVYQVQDYLPIALEERKKRLLYQIEGNDLKVVVRLFLNDRKEIVRVRWFRLKATDSELAFYSVMHFIAYLKTVKKFSEKFVLKMSGPF
ncbi:MAG TPA: hypothetical protein VJY62_11625 [Bacteroidia bacterium]|nr:hypothetical protein [Bacteroidia bacterium]